MLIKSDPSVNPEDLLLWADGFWCLREELCQAFLRDDNYRVILHRSDEWLSYVN
jgi:hypothetical protein